MVAGAQAPTCHSDVILHEPDVVLGLRGEVLPLPGARGVRLPPRQRFVVNLNLLQYLLVRWGHKGSGWPMSRRFWCSGLPSGDLLAAGLSQAEGTWPWLVFSGAWGG